MALIKDFEIPGTGVTVKDAYHVIVNVSTEKRLVDIPAPPDATNPTGVTNGGDQGDPVYWKAGYVGRIVIEVYASKEARDEGKSPIGAIGVNPTDVMHPDLKTVCTPGKDFKVLFFIDSESSDSILTQAYNYLKTTEYYKDAEEV
jgi:hypothetical protein